MLILKPLLPEDLKSKVLKKIENHLKNSKGKIDSQDVWGKRHLAYPIKKHDEGYYVVYQISIPSESATGFQHELKLMGDVLRYVLIRDENNKGINVGEHKQEKSRRL